MGDNLGTPFAKNDTMTSPSTIPHSHSTSLNRSSLVQPPSNLGGTSSGLDPHLEEPSTVPAELISKTNPSQESAGQVDEYTISHEIEGRGGDLAEKMQADKAHLDLVVDAIFANVHKQAIDASTLQNDTKWGEKDLHRSVPFM
jgi:hypothetical protein